MIAIGGAIRERYGCSLSWTLSLNCIRAESHGYPLAGQEALAARFLWCPKPMLGHGYGANGTPRRRAAFRDR